jgi:RimJ/RimL family protein N-acetyltransferase
MDRTWIVLGERVGLTALVREEFVARWDAYNDPSLGMLLTHPTSPKAASASIKPPVTREDREAVWEFVTSASARAFDIRAAEDQRFLGECSLSGITWPTGSAELAVALIDPVDRGHGLGREAVKLLVAYAFDGLGLHRVTMRYLAANEAAVRAIGHEAGTAGGRVVGVEREAAWAYGRHHDCVLLEVLAADFPPHPATAHLREAPSRVELPG